MFSASFVRQKTHYRVCSGQMQVMCKSCATIGAAEVEWKTLCNFEVLALISAHLSLIKWNGFYGDAGALYSYMGLWKKNKLSPFFKGTWVQEKKG